MSIQIPFPLPISGYALNSKMRINLDFLVAQFNSFNTGTAAWDNVSIGTGNSLTGTLTFYNASNANYLTIQAGVTGASTTYTLPINAPSATPSLLYSSTGGVLKWKQLLGTSNQILLADNTSDVTFSLPQSIDTGAGVTFGTVAGTTSVTGGRLLFGNGTAASPGLSLSTEASGLYRAASNVLGWSIAGASNSWYVSASGLVYGSGAGAAAYPLELRGTADSETVAAIRNTFVTATTGHAALLLETAGTSNDPLLRLHSNSTYWSVGIDTSNSHTLSFSNSDTLGTSEVARLSTNQWLMPDGTSSAPGMSFLSQATLGFARTATSEVTLYGAGGTTIAVFNGSQVRIGGNLLITASKNLILEGSSYNTQIAASSSASAAWTLTLPISAGTNNYVLTTNGSGVTSWASPGSITGTVNSGTQYQLGYYAAGGTAISGLTLITGSKALVSDANGLPIASSVTSAELIAGSANITTLGTIATGTWSATTIAVNKGGTGQTSYTDGQLLIGNTTGNTLAKATLTGTSNQVVVTNGSGTITLSTPQSIGTGSSPTFAGLTLSGLTASTVPYLDASRVLTSSTVTPTQLSYLDATSSVQTQINTKAADSNVVHLNTSGEIITANKIFTLGNSDATLYQNFYLKSGGGSSSVGVEVNTYTQTGITTAKTIYPRDAGAVILFIYGSDGAGNDFIDTAVAQNVSGGTVTPISSGIAKGAPSVRTYTQSGGSVQLAMATGTYTTRVLAFDMAPR